MSTLRSGTVHDIIEQTGRALSLPSLGTHLKYSIGKFCSYYLQEKNERLTSKCKDMEKYRLCVPTV